MAGLQTYHRKRSFDRTAEPKGKVAKRKGNAFVIQKHDATRLHYDLRLELDGVMKSWAVTRGPSLNPADKRLAVQTEDHPIEYNKFEGTIPKGQYGGGTVMIWDRGSWEPEDDPHRGFKKGHLRFKLDGEKLSGAWHLVRLRKRPGDKHDNWLLIKSQDDAARGARGKDILEEMPLSVTTGRSLDEIANGKSRVWQSNRPAKENAARLAKESPSKTKTAKSKPVRARAKKTAKAKTKTPGKTPKRKRAKDEDPVPGSKSARLPDFVSPSLATLSEKAPSDASWLHEIKFDGYRIQARLENGRVRLMTRKGLDWTHKFQTIADEIAKLPADAALIDGELVAETEQGVSSFSQLQQDLKDDEADRLVYYAFDLLHLEGYDLTASPLEERKAALERLLANAGKAGVIRLSESFEEEGAVLHAHACRMGLEGIISKKKSSPYRTGRGYDWLKTKCSDRQELVIVGFTPSTADNRALGALVLGYYDDGELKYAGRVGTGFSHQLARDIYKKLQPLKTERSAFRVVPKEERGKNGAKWVEPKLVAEVEFRGWTHGGVVRQGSFQGLREDKSAKDVVREKKIMPAAVKKQTRKSARPVSRAKAKPPAKSKRSSGRKPAVGKGATPSTVKLTNPDRVYWSDVGVTKQDLADYYAMVWDWMAPHVTGRVLAIVRCPDGSTGECFFQKHASAGIDAKRLHLVAEPDGDKAISVDDLDGLTALVQAGGLEIHHRGSSIQHLEKADRLVFDLDPGPGITWKNIVDASREVRDLLDDFNLETFIKTSGGKGLHVVLPIKPTPWDEAKAFCRGVAELMARDNPKRYTASIKIADRGNRIFIDYLRNSREATAVAPYSSRSRPKAPVSVPITWDELKTLKSASQYTVQNLAQRLSRLRKDPWAGIGEMKQALPKLRK